MWAADGKQLFDLVWPNQQLVREDLQQLQNLISDATFKGHEYSHKLNIVLSYTGLISNKLPCEQ